MIDLVIISTLKRIDLYIQTLDSLMKNTSNEANISNFVQVFDNPELYIHGPSKGEGGHVICTQSQYGASRCRNIGAGSIPQYRRGSHVLFLDDDVFMCPRWDEKMMELANHLGDGVIISPYSHPYNQCEPIYEPHRIENGGIKYGRPLVISSVAMMMPWVIFDEVGPWDEPGGPGGSEDYALCMRAKDRGYGFAVACEQCVIHCGLTGSNGKPIVGQKELIEQNEKLIAHYGLEGKVRFE